MHTTPRKKVNGSKRLSKRLYPEDIAKYKEQLPSEW
jgi:hypothetical protein